MSDFTHHRARVAALVQHGAPEAVIGEARRDLAAARLGRAWAAERARLGQPLPSPELQAVVAAALLADAGVSAA
jgi:hypothetical protein